MIARMWKGWARPAEADAYVELFGEVISGVLAGIDGFISAEVLRRPLDDGEVEIMTVVHFRDMDSIRSFAGPEPEVAKVSPAAQALLTRFDPHVTHYQIAFQRR